MKKFFKILGIIVLVIFLILLIAPFFLKGKIQTMVKNAANENVNAVVDFSDVGLSLIRHFPNATLVIDDLSIINKAPFEGTKLAELDELSITVGLFEVISGDQISVKSITANDGEVNVLVLKNGKANYDIAKATAEPEEEEAPAEEGSFNMSLQHYSLRGIDLLYDDKSLGMTIDLDDIDHEGSGDFTEDVFALDTETEIDKANVTYGGVKYLDGAAADLGVALKMNLPKMKFTFKRGAIQVNQLNLQAQGWLAMPEEDIDMDLKFSAPENDLRSIISLIPAGFAKDVEDINTTGDFKLTGFVKGTYNDNTMPGLGINLNVANGTFQYPDLPRTAHDIAIDLKVDAPGGTPDIMKGMKVDLNRFFLALGKSGGHSNTAEAAMKLRNLANDPYIDANAKADMDLGSFSDLVPLEEAQQLGGIFKCDIEFKGSMSAVENQQFNKFTAGGNAQLQNFNYTSADYKATIENADMAFSPQKLNLKELKGVFDETDFRASGEINNYIGYALKDSVLVGQFNLSAGKIDLNKFMEDSGEEGKDKGDEEDKGDKEEKPDTASTSTISVPKNLDFKLMTNIDEVKYDNLSMKNVSGTVIISHGIASLQNLAFNTLGGKVGMSGSYDTQNRASPKFDFAYDVTSIDIKKTATTFNTVEKLAPIAKNLTGQISSKFDLNAAMDGQMNPVLDSFKGGGFVATENVVMEGVEPLNKLASSIGVDKLANEKVKDTKINFSFKNGKVVTEPFDVKLGNLNTNVAGSVSFDQKLDYDLKMEVPTAAFGDKLNSAASGLLGQINNKLGSDLSMGDKVNVTVRVTGPVDDPKFAPQLAGMAGGQGSVKEQVKEKVKEEIEKKKEEVSEELRKRADEVLADAEEKAQQIRDKARGAAEKIRSEADKKAQELVDGADNPIARVGAKTAAKKIREEADNKANDLVNEADKRADQVMQTARDKADEILNQGKGK